MSACEDNLFDNNFKHVLFHQSILLDAGTELDCIDIIKLRQL